MVVPPCLTFLFVCFILFCFVFSQVAQARQGCPRILGSPLSKPTKYNILLTKHFRLGRLNSDILVKKGDCS